MEFLTAKFNQGLNGPSRDPNIDYQIRSVMQTSIGMNFPFSFGQTQCSSRFCSLRQTSLTSSANVSSVYLETSHSASQSSDHDQRYDSISFAMVDEYQSLCNRNFYPPARSKHISLYGRHYGWGAHLEPLRLSFHGHWMEDQSKLHINMLEMMATERSHNIYSPFLHHDIYRQHDSGLIYQKTRRNTLSQSMRKGMGDSQLVPGT